jgi:siroheme decarboxylase
MRFRSAPNRSPKSLAIWALVLEAYRELQQQHYISRIGPVIAPNRIGQSALAAMSVPETEIERVARLVNDFAEVNHNYQREHQFNLWFVLTADNQPHLQRVAQDISHAAGYPLMLLPMLTDYYIDLGFELDWSC